MINFSANISHCSLYFASFQIVQNLHCYDARERLILIYNNLLSLSWCLNEEIQDTLTIYNVLDSTSTFADRIDRCLLHPQIFELH